MGETKKVEDMNYFELLAWLGIVSSNTKKSILPLSIRPPKKEQYPSLSQQPLSKVEGVV